MPVTAYGSSKLAAEKIYIAWQHKDIEDRQLVIVRPGVVFGPGEGGNVSRMIKAVLHRYFFYMGNAQTRKAGIYVKELCHAMMWVLQKQEETGERISLFNMGMNPAPTVEDYVNEICKVAGVKRFVPQVPYPVMLIAAYVIDGIAKLFKVNQPISPVRIRKLVRSNYIVPAYLEKHGYPYQYTFHQALEDWKRNQPGDWMVGRSKEKG